MTRKQKSIAKLLDDAAIILQMIIRLEAADSSGYCRCVTCGATGHYKTMHGGHFISRRHGSTKIIEDNIHVQCPRCNNYLGGNLIAYTLFMEDKYGRARVEELRRMARQPHNYRRADLLEITEKFKARRKELLLSRECFLAPPSGSVSCEHPR